MEFKAWCVIQKLFPYGEFLPCMKLTKTKLFETIRRKNDGWTTYQARKIAQISIRRVNQVYGRYIQTGKVPEIGKKMDHDYFEERCRSELIYAVNWTEESCRFTFKQDSSLTTCLNTIS